MVLWVIAGASTAFAQSSSFTYQGRLTDGGTPANGNYDLQFALWNSLSAGAQVGSTQTLNTVAVSNGVFTVSLDFGAGAFTGASRFLEIGARPAGSGSFTPLTPRQEITSTPYAVRSLNAASADSVPASGVPAGSGNYIQNASSPQSGSNFNISGNGTAGGTLAGNLVNATTQYNLNGSRILSNPGFENLFAGAGAGAANTPGPNSGFGNTFVGFEAGLANTTGARNTFFGEKAGAANTTSNGNAFFGGLAGLNTFGDNNSFFGTAAGFSNTGGAKNTLIGSNADVLSGPLVTIDNATAIGANARVDASNALVLGSINNVGFGTADTNVGIGTTVPRQRLHVKGQGVFTADPATFDPGDGVGPAIRIGFDFNGGYGYINANHTGVTAKNLVLQPNSSQGNVGIGTTAPDQRLSVNGNASKSVGGTTWAVFSDERLKNIKGPFRPGLKALLKLQPIRFQYKPDNALGLPGGSDEVGFSAQAVERVLPEAVSRSRQGYLQLHSDPILWTMLNAIKEQQAQIEKQQELIERQQALADRQQQQLTALKRLVCRSRRRAAACK